MGIQISFAFYSYNFTVIKCHLQFYEIGINNNIVLAIRVVYSSNIILFQVICVCHAGVSKLFKIFPSCRFCFIYAELAFLRSPVHKHPKYMSAFLCYIYNGWLLIRYTIKCNRKTICFYRIRFIFPRFLYFFYPLILKYFPDLFLCLLYSQHLSRNTLRLCCCNMIWKRSIINKGWVCLECFVYIFKLLRRKCCRSLFKYTCTLLWYLSPFQPSGRQILLQIAKAFS